MIAACKKAKVQLAIGYRCQFEPHHLECMRLAGESFGDLKIIEAGFGFRIGDPKQWRLKHELAGSGACDGRRHLRVASDPLSHGRGTGRGFRFETGQTRSSSRKWTRRLPGR
jgi:hypothetical protein